jgi:hypothetical protein
MHSFHHKFIIYISGILSIVFKAVGSLKHEFIIIYISFSQNLQIEGMTVVQKVATSSSLLRWMKEPSAGTIYFAARKSRFALRYLMTRTRSANTTG